MISKPKTSMLQERRMTSLQKRYERLQQINSDLRAENASLKEQLSVSNAKLESIDADMRELHNAIAEAKSAKEQYEEAIKQVKLVKANYSAEMKRLINRIR